MLPLNGTSFTSDALVFSFPTNATSIFDYSAGSALSGSEPLSGHSTNHLTPEATLATLGTTQTLTIPVDASIAFGVSSENDSLLTLKGQLVATRVIGAEPLKLQSIALANQAVTLAWPSIPQQSYQVQATSNYLTWTTVASNLVASGASMTWSTPASEKAQFFRLAQ